MSYADYKKVSNESDHTETAFSYDWEREHMGLLHCAFMETCTQDPTKGQLSVQLYFSNGMYKARVMDREEGLQAFVNLGSLCDGHFLTALNTLLMERKLEWLSMRKNGRSAY